MNKKGFTLVELLAVVVLLAVITTIAVPAVIGISNNIKKNMLETKLDLILEDAKLYGQDNMSTFSNSSKDYNSNPCITISVEDLLDEGYLTKDKDDSAAGYIINPVDNSSLNGKDIILYLKNKRVVAVFEDAENSCS